MDDSKKYASVHYAEYLDLDKLLSAQHPRSGEFGPEAHDEMLFIITHQVYELWFKQIIHELTYAKACFGQTVADDDLPKIDDALARCVKIIKLMIQQIEVIETMTPMDFLEFREYLFPASGFQSYQFRVTEVLLGLKNEYRITYGGYHYAAFFDKAEQENLEKLEKGTSLLQDVEHWLERMPFMKHGEFDFLVQYRQSLMDMIAQERQYMDTQYLDEKQKGMRLKGLGDNETFYKNVFDETHYNELLKKGEVRISYNSMIAALFISLYRDYPVLQMPYKILEKISELDEFLVLWRFRHTQMVRRMIGSKIGTGGSVGVDYLMETALKHPIFKDIQNITTLMVPKQDLPVLPDEVKKLLN